MSERPVLERVVNERKSSSIHDLVPTPSGLKPPGSSAWTTTKRKANAQASSVNTAGIANSSSVVTCSSCEHVRQHAQRGVEVHHHLEAGRPREQALVVDEDRREEQAGGGQREQRGHPGDERCDPQREQHQRQDEQPEEREHRPARWTCLHRRVEQHAGELDHEQHQARRTSQELDPPRHGAEAIRRQRPRRPGPAGSGTARAPCRSSGTSGRAAPCPAGDTPPGTAALPGPHDREHLLQPAPEAPVEGTARRLGGVAVPPRVGVEVPADLELAVPVGQPDQQHGAEDAAVLAALHRPAALALAGPVELGPAGDPRLGLVEGLQRPRRRAEPAGDLPAAVDVEERVDVGEVPVAYDEPLGLEAVAVDCSGCSPVRGGVPRRSRTARSRRTRPRSATSIGAPNGCCSTLCSAWSSPPDFCGSWVRAA